MANPLSADQKALFRATLRDEFHAAWQLLRRARPDHDVYGFGLYTGHDAGTLTLVAFTEQGLDDAAQAYAQDDTPNPRLMLRWSPADSPLLDTTGAVLARSQALRMAMPDLAADVAHFSERSVRRSVFAAIFAALKSLDDDDVFGEGAARAAVLVSVWQYDESAKDAVSAARKLNPAEAVARYEQALDERHRVHAAWLERRVVAIKAARAARAAVLAAAAPGPTP